MNVGVLDKFEWIKELTLKQIWDWFSRTWKFLAGIAAVCGFVYFTWIGPALTAELKTQIEKVTQEKFDAISETLIIQSGELDKVTEANSQLQQDNKDLKQDVSRILEILEQNSTNRE